MSNIDGWTVRGQRIKATKDAQKKRGEYRGGVPPFGFTYDDDRRKLVPIPSQQKGAAPHLKAARRGHGIARHQRRPSPARHQSLARHHHQDRCLRRCRPRCDMKDREWRVQMEAELVAPRRRLAAVEAMLADLRPAAAPQSRSAPRARRRSAS
jgi:hypothetical protein